MNRRRSAIPMFISFGCGLVLAMAGACAGEPSPAALQKLSARASKALVSGKLGPLGAVAHPADNPSTPAKLELGRLLYFDTRISADNTISCATCHDPAIAWAETDPTSIGVGHKKGPRNSPTVLDSAYYQVFFWDGRAASLEEQALGPIENPIEMGMPMGNLLGKLDQVAGYKPLFKSAFGDERITPDRIARAIACFERTVVSGPSAFDEFLAGKVDALSEAQVRGLELFLTKGGCMPCHRGSFFTTQQYRSSNMTDADLGRFDVTKDPADKRMFRTPSLRHVAMTPPYFHDGSEPSLEGAVFFRANAVRMQDVKPDTELRLTASEVKDLTRFMESLNGKLPAFQAPTQFPQ